MLRPWEPSDPRRIEPAYAPRSVDTDMIRSAWAAYGDYEEAQNAGFITGAALPVDGGITAG